MKGNTIITDQKIQYYEDINSTQTYLSFHCNHNQYPADFSVESDMLTLKFMEI